MSDQTHSNRRKADALRVRATRLRWLAGPVRFAPVAEGMRRLANIFDRLAAEFDGKRD
jgi:hypothetical protein